MAVLTAKATVTVKDHAELARAVCEEHKASNVMVLDLAGSVVADFFVIASGRNRIQVQAIAEAVADAMGEAGVRLGHREGYDSARWILLDFGDIVVHIFSEEDRQFYALERLWGNGEPTAVSPSGDSDASPGREPSPSPADEAAAGGHGA